DSARRGDEAPPEVVEPEAVEFRRVDRPAEPLLDVHPPRLLLRVHEDEALLLEPRGKGAEGFLRSARQDDEPGLVGLGVLGRQRDGARFEIHLLPAKRAPPPCASRCRTPGGAWVGAPLPPLRRVAETRPRPGPSAGHSACGEAGRPGAGGPSAAPTS